MQAMDKIKEFEMRIKRNGLNIICLEENIDKTKVQFSKIDSQFEKLQRSVN